MADQKAGWFAKLFPWLSKKDVKIGRDVKTDDTPGAQLKFADGLVGGYPEGLHAEPFDDTPVIALGAHAPEGYSQKQITGQAASQLPYSALCQLISTWPVAGSSKGMGSGSFIRFNNNDRVILTAAHVIHDDTFGRAVNIQAIPGRTGPTITTSYGCTEFRILPKWKEGYRDSQFDYGIILPSKPGGFGNYQTLALLGLADTVIQLWMKEQTKTYVAGWPTDKPVGTLWESPGKLKGYDPFCVSCASDTAGGQSGGPLYAIGANGPVVVGVHVKDAGNFNGARRIDDTMIAQIEWWYNDWNKGANAKVFRY